MGITGVRGMAIGAALVLALTGCAGGGDSGSADESSGTTTETDAGAGDTGATEPDAGDDAAEAPADAASSDLAPELVSEAPSGSPTVSIGANSMDPATLGIASGTVVEFVSGDGSFHGLVVNELSSVTVAESLPEYYLFIDPGTYLASDELTDGTVTITVQ